MPAVTASPATNGAMGFDTAVPLSADQVTARIAQGYRFCVRYVSRTDATRAWNQANGTDDLSAAEAQIITEAGLGLMVVQHVSLHGWVASADLGTQYGANAVRYCQAAGLVAGVTVWLDLEDLPTDADHDDVIAYCNNWFTELRNAGYQPGLYVGFDSVLTSDEFFFRLSTKNYWRADGDITAISHRGYQMFQHEINPGAVNEFDQNVIKTDGLGGVPTWMVSE